jgi:molybdopterin-containing oxidoreductase family molybdopterin binding subunit
MKQKMEIYDDIWIPTQCGRCYAGCGVRVHRINGVAVKIEGNPDTMMGACGGLCAKGASGLQVLYDPNRLRVPLKRTNNEKGLFVDPMWKEITWEEALDTIGDRLKKIDDQRKIWLQITTCRPLKASFWLAPWRAAIGMASLSSGGGCIQCGAGAHATAGMMYSSWSMVPDFKYCNYIIYFGANKGSGSGHSAMMTTRLAAEARARGAKFVVFDPMCNLAGGKATEWVPLIPGTDGAVALAMCNVIVNELGIWDAVYLKTKTNGPYLIGPDKKYVRDENSGKPLVWDTGGSKAKAYDEPGIKDYALEGEYEVKGIKCHPAFHLIRDNLRKYTPEMASKVSNVPTETIHRIAIEFAKAANVGTTITIEGHELPFRPVSAVLFRGGEGHENAWHTCFAVSLLSQIVGAADVPGGTLGWPARSLGYPGTGKLQFGPHKGVDGLLQTNFFGPRRLYEEGPYPVAKPELRGDITLRDIFTLAPCPFVYSASDQEEIWQKIGLPYRFEMLISWGCNSVMSIANREIIAETLKKIPFIVVSELFSTELAEGFADILLPDTCYLEESNWIEGMGQNFNYPFGTEDWCFHTVQPVIKPMYSRRDFLEVVWEIIDRLGKRKNLNNFLNKYLGLSEDNKLNPDDKFTSEQLSDRALKSYFGPDHNWEWFKKHGFIRWPKKIEETYWRYFVDCRVPLYLEFVVEVGEKVKEITEKIGLDVDLSQYTPLIEWFPCSIHRVDNPRYEFYCFSYRDILHTGSHTMEQPWLDEASRMNPYTYNITMNRDAAQKKGLKDGDKVELESVYGRKVEGTLKLMEGQHPETIGIAACSGHWANGMPIAKGKGSNFDILLELDLKHIDPVSFNMETCAKVKINKIGRS